MSHLRPLQAIAKLNIHFRIVLMVANLGTRFFLMDFSREMLNCVNGGRSFRCMLTFSTVSLEGSNVCRLDIQQDVLVLIESIYCWLCTSAG